MNTIKTVTTSMKVGAELFCISDERKKQIQQISDYIDFGSEIIELLRKIVKLQHPEIESDRAVRKYIKKTAKKYNLSLLTIHIVEDISGNKELAFSIIGGNILAFANELGIFLMTPEQNNAFTDYISQNPYHPKEVIYDCTEDQIIT